MSSRINYPPEVESRINQGIDMHLSGEKTYNCMSSICMSDEVALPEFSEFFRVCGMRMRRIAERMKRYQEVRGAHYSMSSD
ncbi:unnamed protein product, partial [Protopolystoma xenopodis]